MEGLAELGIGSPARVQASRMGYVLNCPKEKAVAVAVPKKGRKPRLSESKELERLSEKKIMSEQENGRRRQQMGMRFGEEESGGFRNDEK